MAGRWGLTATCKGRRQHAAAIRRVASAPTSTAEVGLPPCGQALRNTRCAAHQCVASAPRRRALKTRSNESQSTALGLRPHQTHMGWPKPKLMGDATLRFGTAFSVTPPGAVLRSAPHRSWACRTTIPAFRQPPSMAALVAPPTDDPTERGTVGHTSRERSQNNSLSSCIPAKPTILSRQAPMHQAPCKHQASPRSKVTSSAHMHATTAPHRTPAQGVDVTTPGAKCPRGAARPFTHVPATPLAHQGQANASKSTRTTCSERCKAKADECGFEENARTHAKGLEQESKLCELGGRPHEQCLQPLNTCANAFENRSYERTATD